MSQKPKEKKVKLSKKDLEKFYKDISSLGARADCLLRDHYSEENILDIRALRCVCELVVNNHVLGEYMNSIFPKTEVENVVYEVGVDSVLKMSHITLTITEIKAELLQKNISLDVQ